MSDIQAPILLDETDVRALVRILGEVVTVPGGTPARRRHLLKSLAGLVHATVWAWGQARVATGGTGPALFSFIDGGWNDERQKTIATAPLFIPEHARPDFPMLQPPLRHLTKSRRQLLDDADWYSHPVYVNNRAPADLDDFLFSYYPVSPAVMSMLGFHRGRNERPFSDRDRCLVHAVVGEIDWLHRPDGDVVPATADHVATLSPRERQVLFFLLAGDGRKQIAGKLQLSEHTVSDYLKSIHRHFGVNSRGELLALFLSGGGRVG